jgi:hypothetical protein
MDTELTQNPEDASYNGMHPAANSAAFVRKT